MPEAFVLDSFALLAYFHNEPGSQRIEDLLRRALGGEVALLLNVVNYGEILYQRERRGGVAAVQRATAIIDNLPIRVVDVGRDLAFAAAHLKARHSIAYAGALAAALAVQESAAVVTGDPEFATLEGEIRLEWLAG